MQIKYSKEEQNKLYEKFDQLQKKLLPIWEQIGRSDPGGDFIEEENTMVVLPSLTVDLEFDCFNPFLINSLISAFILTSNNSISRSFLEINS